jgi:signal peptide peptidase SppA
MADSLTSWRADNLANLQAGQPASRHATDAERIPYTIENGVAVIPVQGVMARRMNLMMEISGGVSTELLMRDFAKALADTEVDAILLDINSPGGVVGGLEPLAALIYASRDAKPVVAFARDQMASAAYWVGSAAAQIVGESTSLVGSIGVITVHYDYSESDRMDGIKRTFMAAGKYKALGNDAEPLSPDARSEIQDRLDYLYSIFVNTVALHRGTDSDTVHARMADGKVFIGRQALETGLIDKLGTFDDALTAALSMVPADTPKYFRR